MSDGDTNAHKGARSSLGLLERECDVLLTTDSHMTGLNGPEQSSSSVPHNKTPISYPDDTNYLALGCLCFKDPCAFNERHGQTSDLHFQTITADLSLPPTAANHFDLSRLLNARWIRIEGARSAPNTQYLIYRIYILPHDRGVAQIDRKDKKLLHAFESLLSNIDTNTQTWRGQYVPGSERRFDMWATEDPGSLYHMFNQIPSPVPDATLVDDKYKREALEDILDTSCSIPGLKTMLYPFQSRSAGLMLQREAVSSRELDPRLEVREAPDGTEFFYGPWDLSFFRDPRYYGSCRGGILAETMGLGKTLICLAMILATRHHPPDIPVTYMQPAERSSVGSLVDMSIAAMNRNSIPWRVEFERIRHANGDRLENIERRLLESPPHYEIPSIPIRWNRNTVMPPPQMLTTTTTTIIVVPRNLCKQWQLEIEKHVEIEALKVLVMDDSKKLLPRPDVLCTFDIILFSRNRFEQENKHGTDGKGNRPARNRRMCRCPYIGSSRVRDCSCLNEEMIYMSPLKTLHFKRIIVDEGHFFSNSNNVAVNVANTLVVADHRWVISGTPAKDLLGVEMDLSIADNGKIPQNIDTVLEQRKTFSKHEDTKGAVDSLCALASSFLKIEPWCGVEKSRWKDHMYRHEGVRSYTFSGFSNCMRKTLENMVIKTRPQDVRDLNLPRLTHRVVRLEPSFFDKLSANLFTMVLTANAVTSERTDTDYLFHKDSVKARHQLIANLRQSAFCWTGFSESDVKAFIENSERYLSKDGTNCSAQDRSLLQIAIDCGKEILRNRGWQGLSRSHELGIFLDTWPEESAQHWTFYEPNVNGHVKPVLTGITHAIDAQKHVHDRAADDEPGSGLSGAGIKALAPVRNSKNIAQDTIGEENSVGASSFVKTGIPTSSLHGEPKLVRRFAASSKSSSPRKAPKLENGTSTTHAEARNSASSLTSLDTSHQTHDPQRESEWGKTKIVGTTSAKMSYLISQISRYYKDEKILVFYQGDNVAYYISQGLEMLHIKHEIYAGSLSAAKKADYAARFNEEGDLRVLLTDIHHAAFGLNLPSASRIFFVNPVCRPNIEAQAIKRAHRIGQTREVHVETLVLKGTIEEEMFERSKTMTRGEHLEAKALDDDGGVRAIIQGARMLPLNEVEWTNARCQMAPLLTPQQLWFRAGWQDSLEPERHVNKAQKRSALTTETVQHRTVDKRVTADEHAGRFAEVTHSEGPHKRVRLAIDIQDGAAMQSDKASLVQYRTIFVSPPDEKVNLPHSEHVSLLL